MSRIRNAGDLRLLTLWLNLCLCVVGTWLWRIRLCVMFVRCGCRLILILVIRLIRMWCRVLRLVRLRTGVLLRLLAGTVLVMISVR